ncbi:DUF3488 and DUF4129 domain-containing transglutaminase family protein [Salicola sp. Rm-C-2C1-2]|uniref:transglutaminase TgpA family protein n=1 Tax=Salicola sp. Rm-C-2C1-2 TaxID=3141321 RepID=UPI0032E36F9D
MSRHHLDPWVAAFGLILLAQLQRLPLWLSLGAGAAALSGWLLQRYRRRGLRPLWLGVLALASAAAFWGYYRGQFTVDTAASFLVLTVALKWLELGRRRDLFILFFIQCYLAVVTLLFHQSMLWAGGLLVSVFLLFTGLQMALGGRVERMGGEAMKRSALVFVKMLPVVIVLFIFFPRIGPLWSVPLVSDQGMTGLSDSLEPGAITSLAQNDDPAFRVTFGGQTPESGQRYWQALVLDRFDGRRWDRRSPDEGGGISRVPEDAAAGEMAEDEYEVMLEPHGRRWGFALADSVPASTNVSLNHNGMVRFERSVDTRRRYRMKRAQPAQAQRLSESAQRFYTRLPGDTNDRTRGWVAQQRRQSGDREALVRRLMEHFNQEPFHYTLQPEGLGESDTVDALMFETLEGFCEHYASALAFMLRTADIPARIVTGYLGGEPGVDDEYLIVRQYDAHAWVQAWLPGRGWVRLDPTAMIAPDRIENGLRAAMGEDGGFLADDPFSMNRYTDVGWVNWMRLRFDAVNYYWQRWVVGYEGQTQLSLLDRLPGDINRRMLGVITAVLVAVLIMAGVGVSLLRSRRRHFRDPWYRLYDRWCGWLEHRNVAAGRNETLAGQVSAAQQAFPALAADVRALGALLERAFYSPEQLRHIDLARARRLMNAIRKRKPHGRSGNTATAE